MPDTITVFGEVVFILILFILWKLKGGEGGKERSLKLLRLSLGKRTLIFLDEDKLWATSSKSSYLP